MRGPRTRRGWWMVLIAVCVLSVAAVSTAVLLSRDDASSGSDDGGHIDPAEVLGQRRLDLVHRAVPAPGCGEAPASGGPRAGLVALDVVRVDGTCMSTTTEYVRAEDVAARRKALAGEPAVIASAVIAPPDAAEDDRRDDQWTLDMLGVPENSSQPPWPDATGVVVAVLDSGIDAGHPDLAGAVIGRRHYVGEGAPDPTGHGTKVSGVIAARRDNGGIVGVAPGVSLLDVPVQLRDANDQGPSWPVGLAWAVNHGADVVNMSFGGALTLSDTGELDVMAAAVEFARHNNVVAVAGAGNCGASDATKEEDGRKKCERRNQWQAPPALAGVVAVGAVKKDGSLAGYSTRNGDVDLVAPGGDESFGPPVLWHLVVSTAPGGKYEDVVGTSIAAPHVAAAAAVARYAYPQATADQISDALIGAADMGRVAKGDRDDVGAGHGFLDIPGTLDKLRTGPDRTPAPTTPPGGAPGSAADRTQIAYVEGGTLYAFDGKTSHPVRPVDPQAPPRWVEWSADHSFLVGADSTTLFSWAGPGTKAVEKPCDWCADEYSRPAFAENAAVTDPGGGPPTGDLVLRIDADGTLTRYNAHTLEELGSSTPAFPADAVGSKTLQGSVGGKLLVHESGGAHASERLWLVDPVSGQVGPSREVSGTVIRPVAVDAAGDRVAVVTGYSPCGRPEGMYVLDGSRLTEVTRVAAPAGQMPDELFFNGGTLYAGMSRFDVGPGRPCAAAASTGLWRLNGSTWEQVDASAASGRPFEGRSSPPATGWLLVRGGNGAFVPPADGDASQGAVGAVPAGADDQMWSTPTRTEVRPQPPR